MWDSSVPVRQISTFTHSAVVSKRTCVEGRPDAQLENWFFSVKTNVISATDSPVKATHPHPPPQQQQQQQHMHPPPPNKTCSKSRFSNLFLYKKGTIYITFIKSFSIIKYNITLLQKFQIPATIQVKLPRRVHTVSFSHFNSFFKQRPVLHVPTTLTRQD